MMDLHILSDPVTNFWKCPKKIFLNQSPPTKKVAQSSNFQMSGIDVLKFVVKNTNKFNIKIKTVLFREGSFKKNPYLGRCPK